MAGQKKVSKKSKQSLLSSFGPLAEMTSDAVCLCDSTMVVDINRAGLDLLGFAGKKMPIGSPFASLVASDESKKLSKSLSSLTRGKAAKQLDLIGADGRVWSANVLATKLEKPKSKDRVLITFRPANPDALIVGPQNAKDKRYRDLIAASTDCFCIIRHAKVVFINEAGKRMFGGVGSKIVGQPFASLVHPDDQATVGEDLSGIQNASADEQNPPLIRIVGASDEILHVEVRVWPFGSKSDGATAVELRNISRRVRAEEAQKEYASKLEEDVSAQTEELRRLSRQTRQIIDAANEGIIGVDLEGHITMANPTAGEILDRDLSALRGMSIDGAFILGTGSDKAGEPLPVWSDMQRGKYYVIQEARLARGDGVSFEAEYAIAPMRENKETTGYVLTLRDVTDRKQAESELRLAATVFDHTSEGLLVADSAERITKVNRAFTAITGFTEKEVFGQPIRSTLFFDDKIYRDTMTDLQKNGQVEWEQWCKNKSGDRYASRQALSLVRGPNGEVQQFAAILNDITERKLDEEQIRYQANYDQLTGIPNRALFMDRLARLVIESRRTKTNVGLMFIDLDGFKAVNDTLGHDAGDLLLKQTADRLNYCVRESDTVARLGGDEFTVIMPLIDRIESTIVVAERILESLTEPFDLDGQEGRISASIGISIYPEQADDDKQLLHKADVAMFHAKSQGKANYQFYRDGLEIDGVPEREGH